MSSHHHIIIKINCIARLQHKSIHYTILLVHCIESDYAIHLTYTTRTYMNSPNKLTSLHMPDHRECAVSTCLPRPSAAWLPSTP